MVILITARTTGTHFRRRRHYKERKKDDSISRFYILRASELRATQKCKMHHVKAIEFIQENCETIITRIKTWKANAKLSALVVAVQYIVRPMRPNVFYARRKWANGFGFG